MKALLDINVLMDFLTVRKSYEDAASIISLAKRKTFRAYASAHEITTLSYFLEKDRRYREGYREMIASLLALFHVLPVDRTDLEAALGSGMDDFEDAVLESVSSRNALDYIVTQNVSDFARSRIPALTPAAFLELLTPDGTDGVIREAAPSYRTRPRRRRAGAREAKAIAKGKRPAKTTR